MKVWLSVPDSAHILRISPRTIRRWIKAGRVSQVAGHVDLEQAENTLEEMRERRAQHLRRGPANPRLSS